MRPSRLASPRTRGPLAAAALLTLVAACNDTAESAAPESTPRASARPTIALGESTTVATTQAPVTTQARRTTTAPTTAAPTTAPAPTEAPTTLAPTTAPTEPPTTPKRAEAEVAPPVAPVSEPFQAVGARSGSETARIQKRLMDLGFWVAGVDGDYGHTTSQAVLAFQKYHRLDRTGKVNAETAAKLSEMSDRVRAKSSSGSLIEIDKDRQVLFIVRNGRTEWAFNTSTGSGQYYVERNQKDSSKLESGRSVTPSGKFKIQRQRPDGWWEGDLGKIYRPKYFNGGIAVHGMTKIPAYPASHGCVRLSLPAMDFVWTMDWVGKGTSVWVYGDDVPAKGEKPKLPDDDPPSTTSKPKPKPQPTTSAPDTSAPETSAPETSAPETTPPSTP